MTNPTTPMDEESLPLSASERFDYERLKELELHGIKDYREMRNAEPLTAERVVAFINQLSPWNLKTTGVSVLEAYANSLALSTQTVNRFEVINHLPDGSGRELVVWEGSPFTAEFSIQDNGRTLKVFLTDVAQASPQHKGIKPTEEES